MADITKQTATLDGVTVTKTAASAGGDTCKDCHGAWLVVESAAGASREVTIAAVETSNHGTLVDAVSTVAAGDTVVIGPISARFLDVDNDASVTYDDETGLQVWLIGVV